MEELEAGRKGIATWTVTDDMTAEHCQSGMLPVFSTPTLVSIMECAACRAIEGCIPDGSTSVGIEMSLKHSAPSPVGAEVTAEAELTEINGRILSYEIVARDACGVIGTAQHKRAIVDSARFMQKLRDRN